MGKPDTFVFRSYFPCSAADLYAWHSRPEALERLIPPWEKTTVVSRFGGIAPGGRVEMRMHLLLIPYRWRALHVEDEPGVMFRRYPAKGPFSSWSHSHHFTDADGGALLEDRIEFRLPVHSFLPDFVKSRVHGILQRTFQYRHATLREDLLLHRNYSRTPLRILVTGASGVLGRALLPFLTTGGHRVWTLVRRRPDPEKQRDRMGSDGRNNQPKGPARTGYGHPSGRRIYRSEPLDSREKTTGYRQPRKFRAPPCLPGRLQQCRYHPKVFLSASAVGFYGDSQEHTIDERTEAGQDFISEVCTQWGKGRGTCRGGRNPDGSDADRGGLDPEGRCVATAADHGTLRVFPSFWPWRAICELDRYRRHYQCNAALPHLP